MEGGNPERWMFGHQPESFQPAARVSVDSGAAPVFWPPLFSALDAPEGVAPGREGVHVGGEPLSSRNAAGWAAAGVGGRFSAGGRNGAFAAPALGAHADSAGQPGDAVTMAGPVSMLRRDEGQRGSSSAFGALLEGNGTIPEIASDAALSELQARIREDAAALKQFRVETEEQQQHVAALRQELQELHVTLNSLSSQRKHAGSEAEEEERRMSDARRLRSSLRKGLHDAQKRVDGAGHRSRAALRQLQRLLGQASQFVAVEEDAANGGAPPAHGDAPSTPPDAEDCMSDRYSVVDQEAPPAAPQGPLEQLFSWARSVLSVRFALSFSDVSLTLSPGPRRRRKRPARPRAPRSALREIIELPDSPRELGDATPDATTTPEPGSPPGEMELHGADVAARLPALPPALQLQLQLPPSSVSDAAAASASALAAAPAPAAPRMSAALQQGSSVQELSQRLAQRMQDGVRATGAAGRPAKGSSSAEGVDKNNRFARLVSIAGQNAAAAQQPAFAPARAAPPPPHQRERERGGPHGQRGGAHTPPPRSLSQSRGDAAAVSWPLTPLSPQNSAERL